MPRISLHALLVAFCLEILVDLLFGQLIFAMFAGERLVADMSQEEVLAVAKVVIDTTPYLPVLFVFGSMTTVAGAYFAARLAKRIPYYHGLGMGIIGLLYGLVLWSEADDIWLNYLGMFLTVPLSLLGAHLARKRMLELEIL
jgi:hypothetical protein